MPTMFAHAVERCLILLSNNTKAFSAAGVILLIDQLTKFFARHSLLDGIPEEIINEYLRFTLRYNFGAAFSLKWGGPIILTVFTALACFFLVKYMLKVQNGKLTFWLGIILGGALGNLIDRILMGKVTDFIDVGVTGWRWPTFNIADIAICIGGIVVFFLFKNDKQLEVPTKEQENE